MQTNPRIRGVFARAALLALAITLGSCLDRDVIRGSGTIEMDEVDVASLTGGRVVSMSVREGDSVAVGDTVAVLDRGEVIADLATQLARAQGATSQYRDLESGARPEEVLAARADLAAAQAEAQLAESNFARTQKLAASNVVAQQDLDRARATRDAAAAKARAASENLRMRETGFRRQQVTAARQAAEAATAQLAGARSRASELVLTSPIRGIVLLRNFEPGEVVQPGAPVVTLGNTDSLWMRVYVAAPKLASLRIGSPAEVKVIGEKKLFAGRVIEIATHAEFTPRAALTEEEQANLVFGVKLALAPSGGALKAGLPADARIPRHE